MSDNPFADPDDSDQTVVRVPGSAAPRLIEPRRPTVQVTPQASDGPETIRLAVAPLIDAAAPLLQLVARLRNTASAPDPNELRERAVRQVRAFEAEARAAGIPADILGRAHYALCASVDDAVLNTPWGSMRSWDARSLVSTFHKEVRGGERFFDILSQAKQDPGKSLPLLELLYLCLSLGFMGRYRLSPKGPAEIDRLREDVYALLQRNRPAANPELSPNWKGIAAPYRPARGTVPVWVALTTAAALTAGIFGFVLIGLNRESDDLFARLLHAPPAHMPRIARAEPVRPPAPISAPAEPSSVDRLRTFLKPEIDQGLVTVLDTPSTPVVRIRNRGMFASASASLNADFMPLLNRIAQALNDEQGSVQVIGYTDNQPIRTVRFPSNFQLSAARAEAARSVLARSLADPSRLSAEGRADADPVGSNATREGQEANRRIEIVLRRPT
jgi:type VI secretion system protein ImpK